MNSWIYLDVIRAEHEERIRRIEQTRALALARRSPGSPSALRSFWARFGRS
jgi:hypothetical protein